MGCFAAIFFWIILIIIAFPSHAASLCEGKGTLPANEPVKAISEAEALKIARDYLKIENKANYKIKIEEKIITTNAINTYRILKPGITRLCWIVTFIVPDAVGASRTVYVDQKGGEILGGFSSK